MKKNQKLKGRNTNKELIMIYVIVFKVLDESLSISNLWKMKKILSKSLLRYKTQYDFYFY